MEENTNNKQCVLFVCEHGSAKSVVAAEHFNKAALDIGMGIRAISRGTDPDQEFPPNVWQGLEGDGLMPGDAKPVLLREEDLSRAMRVVTFCKLNQKIETKIAPISWEDVPPVSDDYSRARDEIVKRIGNLLNELEPKMRFNDQKTKRQAHGLP